MYTDLIQEDIMTLDNEFFKINTMFETVDKMYDIRFKELEYNYIYTESINETYTDLYTEAENNKVEKEQGLLGRLFTAILNFTKSVKDKILKLFSNVKKNKETENKILKNSKIRKQKVVLTDTKDAVKAVDEGTSFFSKLIDKITKGTATEKDAEEAEKKGKSLISRIAIFAGAAAITYGVGKVVNTQQKKQGNPTIQEIVENLFKRREKTQENANKSLTKTENILKKGQASINNMSSNNEENINAGRKIINIFKSFISKTSSMFTNDLSEINKQISSVSKSNGIILGDSIKVSDEFNKYLGENNKLIGEIKQYESSSSFISQFIKKYNSFMSSQQQSQTFDLDKMKYINQGLKHIKTIKSQNPEISDQEIVKFLKEKINTVTESSINLIKDILTIFENSF